MPQKILVTGAAGFIGSHLCRRLVEDGDAQIVAIDNLRSGDWARCPAGLTKVEADIAEVTASEWQDLCSGVDYVYHLAAEKYNSSKSTPDKVLATNVVATERLSRAAALAGVKRFTFTSSLYAYGSLGPATMCETDVPEPITLYGASKVMGEHILRSIDREIGLSWNVARLFFIYGPRQYADGGYKSVIISNFERLLQTEPALVLGDGNQALDYVYVADCVKALELLGTANIDRQVVNVASGHAYTINELTDWMNTIAGTPGHKLNGPADWTAGSTRVGDAAQIRAVFGWNATTSIEEGLLTVFRWMREGSK